MPNLSPFPEPRYGSQNVPKKKGLSISFPVKQPLCFGVVQKPDCLGVADFAALDHGDGLVERRLEKRDMLVSVDAAADALFVALAIRRDETGDLLCRAAGT